MIEPFRTALCRDPARAGDWNDLGLRFFMQGRLDEAITALSRSLSLQPVNPESWSNLGTARQYLGELGQAIEAFRRALSQAPQHASIHLNLGNALLEQGRIMEAITAYKSALAVQPNLGIAEMNLSAAHLYQPGAGLETILSHARRWSRSPLPAAPARPSTTDRPKIGLISADFRQHAVGYLTIPAIEGLARLGHSLTLYANSWREDELTARFVRSASQWRQTVGLDDAALEAQIRADGIDILIDLSGFSAGNRMNALARKPAPIQIASWVGYPATTGLAAMDYILADRHQIPEGADRFYSEKVLRLPDSYVSFEPPADAPDVGALPCIERGHVTFGSFNVAKKINPQVVSLWSRVMRTLPGSRLLMKGRGFDCQATREHFITLFASNGIAEDRLQLVGSSPPAEHLGWMREADLALDPFPYSGGRTTLEALWMGLPLVTLPTASFAGRHSFGYLQTLGLSKWIARDETHYVDLAVALALDPAGLAKRRQELRAHILTSVLADTGKFARDLDTMLMTVWKDRHAG